MRARVIGWAAASLLLGCSSELKESAAEPQAHAGLRSPSGTSLAYEHRVAIELAAERIPERVAAAQASCLAQEFGDCAVLSVEQQSGEWPSASLTVRIAPEGVDPLLAVAGDGGELSSRSTRAEDLAQAVEDNAAKRARLAKMNVRLAAFAERKDLKLEDALTLSREMATLEVELEQLGREAAQQRRRIDTNLLAISFSPPGAYAASNELVDAIEESRETFLGGAALVVHAIAFLAPLLVFAGVVLAAIRAWRRRRKRGA